VTVVEALFWPALLAYGEAAFAYTSTRTTRLAIWGVRIGWLVQTCLLAVQAAKADGFPWATWGASLDLFVWLVVGAYLIWGCRPRFRLLGLAVMPLAAVLFLVARLAGATQSARGDDGSNLFLAFHVGLVLSAFAGFTLAAGLSGLYLWQERRLKRRASDVLRVRVPPLASLERLAWRTIAVSAPLLALGAAAGFVRARQEHRPLDALEAVTWLTLAVYAAIVLGRPSGRRLAYLALTGFVLVAVARLALAGSHVA
jgi:ABC-type uncharacterized transport system permease subunit